MFADERSVDEVLWALADRVGTVRAVAERAADGSVSVVNRTTYDAFGKVVSQSNAAKATAAGFTGQEPDPVTGLVWYSDGTPGGRWYDPAAGRFLSEDVSVLTDGPNPYRYAGNAPYDHADPSGRRPPTPRAPVEAPRPTRLPAAAPAGTTTYAGASVPMYAPELLADLRRSSSPVHGLLRPGGRPAAEYHDWTDAFGQRVTTAVEGGRRTYYD
ncbi:MAG TPA: RHS repeat-associated core domain-containing protein, partial [Planctomycetaceae bacterium]